MKLSVQNWPLIFFPSLGSINIIKYKKVLTKIEEVKIYTFKRLQETSRCKENLVNAEAEPKKLQVTTVANAAAKAGGPPRRSLEASPESRHGARWRTRVRWAQSKMTEDLSVA